MDWGVGGGADSHCVERHRIFSSSPTPPPPPPSFHCFYYSDCGIPIIYFAFLFQGIFKFQRSSQLYSREVTINSSLHLPISLISIYLYFLHCSSLCFFYWFLSFHSAPFQNFISITSNIILAEKRDVNALLIFLLFIKM